MSKSVVDALSFFYTLVGVSLFVPIVAGLYLRRPRALDALAAIAGGIVAAVAVQFGTDAKAIGLFTPAMCGLTAAAVAFGLVSIAFSQRRAA